MKLDELPPPPLPLTLYKLPCQPCNGYGLIPYVHARYRPKRSIRRTRSGFTIGVARECPDCGGTGQITHQIRPTK
jgi:hypothetical protein